MIVHKVTIGNQIRIAQGEYKKIYVGCAECDIQYRDMLVSFKHRWGFYTVNKFDFLTYDRNGFGSDRWKESVKRIIFESDGVMLLVSKYTALNSGANWEIDCAVSNHIPIVGVDIRKNSEGNIPKKLAGKMTRYGWEWFSEFIDGI
jgi:hypothetical protein